MRDGYGVEVKPKVEDGIIEKMREVLVEKGVSFEGKADPQWVLIAAIEILQDVPPNQVWDSVMAEPEDGYVDTRLGAAGNQANRMGHDQAREVVIANAHREFYQGGTRGRLTTVVGYVNGVLRDRKMPRLTEKELRALPGAVQGV